eukprot:15449523-Alexandrium_andersonii.AAC.1
MPTRRNARGHVCARAHATVRLRTHALPRADGETDRDRHIWTERLREKHTERLTENTSGDILRD